MTQLLGVGTLVLGLACIRVGEAVTRRLARRGVASPGEHRGDGVKPLLWCSDGQLHYPSRCWVEFVELEMSVAREPCSKRKFQSHPTVPPGRLIVVYIAKIWYIPIISEHVLGISLNIHNS